jgi:hypothetical protein
MLKKMNQNVKKKWVKALRSRKYKQCTGRLCKTINGEKSYCCLGVLCDIYNSKLWGKEFDEEDGELPIRIMEWAGLESCDPILNTNDDPASFLNDTKGKKFYEIANYIDRNL